MMCRITFLYLDYNAIGAQTRIVLSETPSFITIDLIRGIYGWLQSGFPNTMASRQQVHWCVPNYLDTLAARKYGLLLIAHTSHVCCCDVPTFGFLG